MNINELTGMPELPEGHFWRITSGFGSEYLRIQVRKRRWLGSSVVVWTVVAKDEATPRKIRQRAASTAAKLSNPYRWVDFVGDYPPKRLSE